MDLWEFLLKCLTDESQCIKNAAMKKAKFTQGEKVRIYGFDYEKGRNAEYHEDHLAVILRLGYPRIEGYAMAREPFLLVECECGTRSWVAGGQATKATKEVAKPKLATEDGKVVKDEKLWPKSRSFYVKPKEDLKEA